MMLAACTPTVQHAQRIPLQYAGPHFDVAAHRFYTFDGAPLGLSAWEPVNGEEPWAVIIGLHGMNDYGEANFYLAGPWFAERGVATYAYDARGMGRSPDRGVWGGENLMTEDVRTAVAVARREHPNAIIAVVGESMGAATAMVALGSPEGLNADRIVLVAPAVWGWSTMPSSYAMTLWTTAHMFPWQPVQPPRGVVRHIAPSDNTEMLRHIGRDRNMLFTTRIDALYGLVNLMEDAAQAAPRMHGNVAFLYGAHDQVVPRASAVRAAQRLPASVRTGLYPDGYHLMLRDLHREVVYEDILAYLHDPDAAFPSGVHPLVPRPVVQANR